MSQQWKSSPDGGDDVQMPLGTGGGDAPAEEYSAPRGPRINASTFALVAAFAAGLVVLYLLGLQNKPRAASAQEVEHERLIATRIQTLLGNKNETDSVDGFLKDSRLLVEKLRSYFSEHGDTQGLARNPFERDVAPVFIDPGVTKGPITEIPPDNVKAVKLRQVAEEFSKLKLQMAMVGTPSVAMINNRMVSVGTQLGSFIVQDIRADSVDLSFEENKYTLKNGDQQMNK